MEAKLNLNPDPAVPELLLLVVVLNLNPESSVAPEPPNFAPPLLALKENGEGAVLVPVRNDEL